MRESKLMLGSSSWNPSRQVRALIAVGLAIIGAVLVWAALARPSTPDSALAPVPNGDGMPSTSPSSTKASRERPKERADHVRDQITGLVLPESHPVAVSIPKLGVRSPLATLGSARMERWRCQKTLPARAGSLKGPHQVHLGRPSSPGT
jgi:hypothetical protein